MSEKLILSHRLESIAKMVTPGGRIVDVGCDHGFLAIYMVEQKIADWCLAMDLRRGPLSNAQKHVEEAGLEGRIVCRLSDGLKCMEAGEADKMVCAGMGGPLIIKILEDSFEKIKGMQELVLSPQSEIPEFRIYLRERGLKIFDENMVKDEGKFYFIFKVRFTGDINNEADRVGDNFGKILPDMKNPVLKEYLDKRKESLEEILLKLKEEGRGEKAAARVSEINDELDVVNETLKYYA
ncbi:MAG: class I SAM-dependent methyltransferase [Acetatifactor sp.]|nr:class I SAM-dependent methyltransferase [Acetatifactor sp.]